MKKEKEYDGFYKDFLDGRAALSTIDSVFSNADCLFCEFNDIITPTWLGIIDYICRVKPKSLKPFIDISPVENLDGEHLIMWYAMRNNRNALLDLKREGVDDTIINNIANELFKERFAYYNADNNPYIMNYAYVLTRTMRVASLVIKKFVIYVEQCNDEVDKFITSLYGSNIDIRSGNLVAALGDISNNSTFVFSDVFKINALKDAGKLGGSSILLADGYRYNYHNSPGVEEDLLVDIGKLRKDYEFELNSFNNFTD